MTPAVEPHIASGAFGQQCFQRLVTGGHISVEKLPDLPSGRGQLLKGCRPTRFRRAEHLDDVSRGPGRGEFGNKWNRLGDPGVPKFGPERPAILSESFKCPQWDLKERDFGVRCPALRAHQRRNRFIEAD
jgi:hypothetical protein